MSGQINGTGVSIPSLWKTIIHSCCMINTHAVDVLVMRGDGESIAMILTQVIAGYYNNANLWGNNLVLKIQPYLFRISFNKDVMFPWLSYLLDGYCHSANSTQIARFMGPTWGPPGSCRPQMGPMLAPWTLLSRQTKSSLLEVIYINILGMYFHIHMTFFWYKLLLIMIGWSDFLGLNGQGPDSI